MTYGPDPGTPAGQPGPYPYQGQPPYAPPGQPPYAPQEPPGYFMGRKLAGWGARVGANLLDTLFIAAPALVVAGLAVALLLLATRGLGPDEQPNGTVVAVAVVLFCLAFLVNLGLTIYSRYYLQGTTGQSWGKRVMHLRLVRMADGQPIGGGMAFVRDIAHTVDGLICYVGYLMPLWDDRRQTVADKMLNTVVLDER